MNILAKPVYFAVYCSLIIYIHTSYPKTADSFPDNTYSIFESVPKINPSDPTEIQPPSYSEWKDKKATNINITLQSEQTTTENEDAVTNNIAIDSQPLNQTYDIPQNTEKEDNDSDNPTPQNPSAYTSIAQQDDIDNESVDGEIPKSSSSPSSCSSSCFIDLIRIWIIFIGIATCLLGTAAAIGYGGYETVQAGIRKKAYGETFTIPGECEVIDRWVTTHRSCHGSGSKRKCSTSYKTHHEYELIDNYNGTMPCDLGFTFTTTSGYGYEGDIIICYTNDNCDEIFTSTDPAVGVGWIYFAASLVFIIALCYVGCFVVSCWNHSVDIGKKCCGSGCCSCNKWCQDAEFFMDVFPGYCEYLPAFYCGKCLGVYEAGQPPYVCGKEVISGCRFLFQSQMRCC